MQNCGNVLVGDKGVGTFGGSEDHTAIMSGEYMKLKMFSYCPTRYEGEFKFPEKYVLAVSFTATSSCRPCSSPLWPFIMFWC